MVRRPPAFEVRRNTPSRRATPSIQPRAMTKVTERLTTSDSSARRYDMAVQWHSIHVVQIVAMTMSDSGRKRPAAVQRGDREAGMGGQQAGDQ